jgi:hypothetical protein
MPQEEKVQVVKVYNGKRDKWAVGRFRATNGKSGGHYYLGMFVSGGINFDLNKNFSSQEDCEGWLVYHIDGSVNL